MDDLVKRLRGYGSNRCWPHGPACDCTQAADRIEQLEARVAAADKLAEAVTHERVKLLAEMERKALRKTEFAAMLAVHCNGGDWSTDYTKDQKNIWRDRAERLRKDPSAIEPAPQEPEKYTIGDLTMARVFRAAGLTNVSDMQAVFDQVEVALRHAIEPAPVSVREAARVLLDAGKDGELWLMYVNAMMPVLNADLSADSWNTVDEIRAAFAAGLCAIAEGKE